MNTWYECKVNFDKTSEDGIIKKVTEPYLVDALSFTEAETRICKEVQPYTSGEFAVQTIKRCKIAELIYNENGDKWYKCRINLITFDENKGVEKRLPQNIMIQASDLLDAVQRLHKALETTMGDYELTNVAETAILDVFPYQAPEQ